MFKATPENRSGHHVLLRTGVFALSLILGWGMPALVVAASGWNPTLLVNTESFNTIDDGDGTTNIEMRFGDTLQEKIIFNRSEWRFEFSQSIYVGGDVTATGSLSIKQVMSGAALRVDSNADIWGKLSVSGATILDGNVSASGALAVEGAAAFGSTIKIGGVTYTFPASDGTASGKVLKTDGAGNLSWSSDNDSGASAIDAATADGMFINQGGDTMTGTLIISNGAGLNASGSLITNTNLTINSDNGAADAVLTFGNDAGAETLKFNDTTNQFELSDDLAVTGKLSASDNISGSGTLAIEGAAAFGSTIKIGGVTYTFPASDGTSSGKVLKTDGAGNLSWSDAVGVGSGGVLFLSPEYPHAVYFGSGSTYIGQLSYAYDSTNKENYYHWTSSKAELQDYWISVRVRVPDTFSAWDANRPIQFRYRTTDASNTVNYATIRLLDTTGAAVALTGGDLLANTSWTTAAITGPASAGTYTKGGYITLLIKLAMTSAGSADAGYINVNWETTAE